MGIDERLQCNRVVRVVRINARQRSRSQNYRSRFNFPENLLRLRVATIVKVLNFDDVHSALFPTSVVRLDSPHCRQTIADPYRLSNFGESCFFRSSFHSEMLQGFG